MALDNTSPRGGPRRTGGNAWACAASLAIGPGEIVDSETREIDAYLKSLHKYLGDVSYFDPTILKAYDETLTRIDGAVGEAN